MPEHTKATEMCLPKKEKKNYKNVSGLELICRRF